MVLAVVVLALLAHSASACTSDADCVAGRVCCKGYSESVCHQECDDDGMLLFVGTRAVWPQCGAHTSMVCRACCLTPWMRAVSTCVTALILGVVLVSVCALVCLTYLAIVIALSAGYVLCAGCVHCMVRVCPCMKARFERARQRRLHRQPLGCVRLQHSAPLCSTVPCARVNVEGMWLG